MTIFVCSACGTSYPEAQISPSCCPTCEDERQFVPRTGQKWTTAEDLSQAHVNAWRQLAQGLLEIHTRPDFGIGQRALLLQTPGGNLLWDCLALIDEATERLVRGLGGISAIAISHPHYYTRMQDWAAAFDCPIYLHAADRDWVMRPSDRICFWEGDQLEIVDGVTLLRLGGHFPGGTVLHWAAGADGRGALLSGDIVQVAADTRRVSFQWSYPNMLPLSAMTVRRMAQALAPWPFERLYGAFPNREVLTDAAVAAQCSAARYIELLSAEQA